MRQDASVRSALALVVLIGVLSGACGGDDETTTATETITKTVTNTETVTITREPPPMPTAPPGETCLGPAEVRKTLLADIHPEWVAYFIDPATPEYEGNCCDPGIVINTYDEYGQPLDITVGDNRGDYGAIPVEDAFGHADDVTFTQAQWIRFSNWAARECLVTI